MDFLIQEDLKAKMFERFIIESSGDGTNILDNIERQNISLFESKLSERYDTEDIFLAEGNDRHPLIVKYLTIFVLFDLIRRNAARKIPSDLEELRKEAMKWLNDVRDGKEHPFGLPLQSEGDFPNPDVLYGNNRNENFYL